MKCGMHVKVPKFISKGTKRKFFIVVAWIITIVSLGIVKVHLEDADGFDYKTD